MNICHSTGYIKGWITQIQTVHLHVGVKGEFWKFLHENPLKPDSCHCLTFLSSLNLVKLCVIDCDELEAKE